MAAQALAGAGFAVLQIDDNVDATTGDDRMGALYAEGYRAGIQTLVDKRVADPDKVGLIAFSATGFHLISLLAENGSLLRAASVSDAVQPGYLQELLAINTSTGDQIRSMNGGSRRNSATVSGLDEILYIDCPASRQPSELRPWSQFQQLACGRHIRCCNLAGGRSTLFTIHTGRII